MYIKKKQEKKEVKERNEGQLVFFFSVNYRTSRFPLIHGCQTGLCQPLSPLIGKACACPGGLWGFIIPDSSFLLPFFISKIPCLIMDGFTEALSDEPKVPTKRNRPGSPDSTHSRSSSLSKNSLQDRLFTKYAWNGFLPRFNISVGNFDNWQLQASPTSHPNRRWGWNRFIGRQGLCLS